MSFNILAVGDVVGNTGLDFISKKLRAVKKQYNIAFTVVNGENASMSGLTRDQAEEIYYAGADVVTLGNHAYNRVNICDFLDDSKYILRPANYAPQSPGRGWGIFDSPFGEVCVIDLIGRCGMHYGPDNPFLEVERILKKVDTKFVFVEFHADATSEKLAMAYNLDGRVSAVWGTHTHVQTSDAEVFPGGMGYITDLGMTGAVRSVIGVKPSISLSSFRGDPPLRYEDAGGAGKMECAVFSINEKTGRCESVQALRIV